MSIDERTRVDGQVEPVDPATCFEEVLPAAFERERDLLAAAVAEYAPRPLTIEVDGDAWTLAVDDGVVRVVSGRDDDAPTVLRTNRAQLQDLVERPGDRGRHADQRLARPARRALRRAPRLVALAARRARRSCAAHEGCDRPGRRRRRAARPRPQLRRRRAARRDGRLPPTRRLPPPRPVCSTEDEMAAVSRDMDAAAPTYSRGDGRSWWARNRGGDDLLVRMQYFDQVSPTVERLVADDRLQRLADLTGDDHVYGDHGRTTASRRCSSRSTWSRASPTCRGTRTARSVVTATTAAA